MSKQHALKLIRWSKWLA